MSTRNKENLREKIMTSQDVIDLYDNLEKVGIKIWIDGGWGVDALLCQQTRKHKDLDLVVQEKDVSNLRKFLEDQEYVEIKPAQARPFNFVLGDENGHEIDVHVIVLNENGDGIYGPKENGQMYPAPSLTGIGEINKNKVRCVSVEWTIKFHSGYKLKEKDYQDVHALCEKFGIQLPEEYKEFQKS